MQVKFIKVLDTAKIPTQGTPGSAGYDLYNAEAAEYYLAPGETKMFHTGLEMAIPDGYFGGIYARSGLSIKHGLRPANCTGIVDSSFRGEVLVALHNDSTSGYLVGPGERIAQLIVQPYMDIEFAEVDDLDETERGEGGFGSTGR